MKFSLKRVAYGPFLGFGSVIQSLNFNATLIKFNLCKEKTLLSDSIKIGSKDVLVKLRPKNCDISHNMEFPYVGIESNIDRQSVHTLSH